MTLKFLFNLLGSLSLVVAQAQSNFPGNPDQAKIHTTDIALFWKIFDQSSPKFSAETLQKNYLDAGSPGLKAFIPMRIESGKNLAKNIKQNLAYYQNIRASSLSIDDQRDMLQGYFSKLKKRYPAAVFPDVYFVIGAKNTGGTTFNGGLIIGAEMFGRETSDFKPRLNIELVNQVVIHELVHFQQNYAKDNTLLAQCIKEGAADFICELVTGSHANQTIYTFGDSHKKELWAEFQQNLDSSNWSPWLYRSKDKNRPQDLGYWMGYQIVKAFYERMEDKEKAVFDILNIKDFKNFLQISGYQGQ